MKCDEVNDLMNRELDGDLNEEEQHVLEQHLKGCSECAELLENLRFVTVQLRSLPKVNPPIDIVSSILPELESWDREHRAESSPSVISKKVLGQVDHAGDHENQQNERPSETIKPTKSWSKKKWWVPGSAVAAAALAIYIVTAGGPFSSDQRDDLSLYSVQQDADMEMGTFDARESFDTAGGEEIESYENTVTEESIARDMAKGNLDEIGGALSAGPQPPIEFVSPDQKLAAIPDNPNHTLNIKSVENNDPAYSIQTKWEEPWFIAFMDWVADDQLYIMLHEPKSDEYLYLLVDVTDQSEELLDEPYSYE